MAKSLERASTSLDLVRNRSDKDRERAETLQMIVERVRELQTDIDRFAGRSGGGADRIDGMLSSVAEIDGLMILLLSTSARYLSELT